MSDISLNANLKTDAEYSKEFDAIMAEIDEIMAQMDKTSAETARLRAKSERLDARNAAAMDALKKQMDALWGAK